MLGGRYHLAGSAVERRIDPTKPDLATLVATPRVVAHGHSTGWRSVAALANVVNPTGYAYSVVGTRYSPNAS